MALRVLVVDPDRHAREGLRAILASSGMEVSAASDIAAGFTCVSSLAYDLLLVDADVPVGRMVRLDALDLLRLARLVNPAVRGLLVTSSVEDLEASAAVRSAATVIEKPVDLVRLRQELACAADIAREPSSACSCAASRGR